MYPHSFISVTDAAENELLLPAARIRYVEQVTGGTHTAIIHMDGGGQYAVNETHSAIYALLETLRDEYNAALAGDVSGRRVAVADANYTILAADSGKPHIIADVSADRTFTFPAEVDGLDFEFFPDLNAADGHDWIFDTGSDTNYFTGGVVHLDTDADAAGDEVVVVAPDGNSNSKLQVDLPAPGTRVRFICNGTTWTVSGIVVSTTAPAFADQ